VIQRYYISVIGGFSTHWNLGKQIKYLSVGNYHPVVHNLKTSYEYFGIITLHGLNNQNEELSPFGTSFKDLSRNLSL